MPIREFFHLIHVVDDMDEVDAWYDALFSTQCFQPKGFADLEKRWASLSMIGDFMIEVIEPSSVPGTRASAAAEVPQAIRAALPLARVVRRRT